MDDYTIVRATLQHILIRTVKKLGEEGWIPAPGFAVTHNTGSEVFYQAMYKPRLTPLSTDKVINADYEVKP